MSQIRFGSGLLNVVGRDGSLFAQLPPETQSPLPEMTSLETTVADYRAYHDAITWPFQVWRRPA